MGVVLHKPSDPRQPRQRTRRLVPMDDTKLCHPDRELLVTSIPRVKDDAMPWAIHRFQSPFLLLDVERKHVVLIVLPVSGGFPEFTVVHIWGDDWRLGYWSAISGGRGVRAVRHPPSWYPRL